MPKKIQVYGIKNCDTVRKSIKWLSDKELNSDFHDLKKEDLDESLIVEWLDSVGQDKLINKRGLTWRKLEPEQKIITDQSMAISLIQENPTLVKRPVVYNGVHWSVGFNPQQWDELFL